MHVPLFVPPGHFIIWLLLFRVHQLPGKGELSGHGTHAQVRVLLLQLGTLLRAEVEECTPVEWGGRREGRGSREEAVKKFGTCTHGFVREGGRGEGGGREERGGRGEGREEGGGRGKGRGRREGRKESIKTCTHGLDIQHLTVSNAEYSL